MATLIDPTTGAPIETYPDDVAPGDLVQPQSPGLVDPSSAMAASARAGRGGFVPQERDPTTGIVQAQQGVLPPPPPPEPATGPAPGTLGGAPSADLGAPGLAPPRGADPLQALADATQVDPNAVAAHRQALSDAAKAIGPTTHSQTSESYVQPTAGMAIARGNQGIAAEGEIDVARRAKDLGVASATDEAKARQVEADQLAASAQRAQEQQAAARKTYEQAQTYLAAERQKVIKANTTSYWEDKGTGARVLAALSVGLGAFSSAITGGQNAALMIINKAMDDEARRKEGKLHAQLDELGLKGADAKERLGYAQTEIANWKAGVLDKLIQERAVRLAKQGVGEAEIKGDALISGLERRKADENVAVEQSLQHHVTRATSSDNALQQQLKLQAMTAGAASPDKSIGEAKDPERNADKYVQRAVAELGRLKEARPYVEKDMKEIEAWRAKVGAEIGQTTVEKALSTVKAINGDLLKRLSPEGKQRFLAEQALAESILRPDSGAAISGGEYIDKMSGFQAMRGDTSATLRQKADRAVGAVASIAGQSYRPGYWYQQLKGSTASGGQRPLEPAQIASLNKLIQANPKAPEAQEARALLTAQARR